MKKVLFLFVAVLCTAILFANPKKKKKAAAKATTEVAATPVPAPAPEQTQDAKKTPLAFKEIKHTFGKIKQGTPVSYTFEFKNAAGEPVVIESATAQCGCTTPEYPKSPINKNASEKIKVTYNAASVGMFTKQVTVRVAKYADPIILTIDGEVLAAEQPAAEPKKD